MFGKRQETRRADRLALRPTLDGRLEPRMLMAHLGVAALSVPREPAPNQILTGNGGRKSASVTPTANSSTSPSPAAARSVRTGLPGHRIGLVVSGTSVQSTLEIEPKAKPARKGLAHQYAPGLGTFTHMMNVGSIVVRSGQINAIFGYRTAELSGPVTIANDANNPIDRIAFYSLLPGASITTGGDVNTLDVYNDTNLSGAGTGIHIGRDLNWFNTAGNISITNGANFIVGRDLGLTAQGSKGTDAGGQGALIQGNVTIDPSSSFVIQRNISAPIVIQGNFSGANQLAVNGSVTVSQGVIVLGTVTP